MPRGHLVSIYARSLGKENFTVYFSGKRQSLGRLRLTFTPNGKRQIQVGNLSEQKISR